MFDGDGERSSQVRSRQVIKRAENGAECGMQEEDRKRRLLAVIESHEPRRLELEMSDRAVTFAGHAGMHAGQ